jgi:hypothetical protein
MRIKTLERVKPRRGSTARRSRRAERIRRRSSPGGATRFAGGNVTREARGDELRVPAAGESP